MSDADPIIDEACDNESRRQITDELHRNFLVEAAAGTGKTTSIVRRMVNLIASGACQIENLVAVTFTRKAAAELRERFQAALRQRAAELSVAESEDDRETYIRLQQSSDNVSRAFVGTIHSFCASILKERPVEFGVDPAFRELDEDEDYRLREQAWYENINDLFATNDPLIDQIHELGIDRKDLKHCFDRFIEYRDVENWPCGDIPSIDIESYQREAKAYVAHMATLIPMFPLQRGTDKLMARYEEIVRFGDKAWNRLGHFFRLLEKFDTSDGGTQKCWHDKAVAKAEQKQWKEFRQRVVKPAMEWWCRKRYAFVVEFVRRAVDVYERQKRLSGSLDFTDLLLTATDGLRRHPQLREYFQRRFTHLLVDEFQDTDPIQAEMLLYLTSADVHQQDWHQCQPRPGSLFLVGDPKQSIYRFRRGDIVTYNRVKAIFENSGGEILSLVKNFRSREELRTWNNRVYRDKFLHKADAYQTAAEDMAQGRLDAAEGELSGVCKLTLQAHRSLGDATAEEAESIARFIRHAIDSKMTVPRRQRELDLGRKRYVEPRDFLIIPRGKRRIHIFKEALDRYGLPCEVTGGNALEGIDQLQVLVAALWAIDDPHHGVHYLTILRDRLFALSDVELYEFKKAGGRFSFLANVPEGLRRELRQRIVKVNARLSQYQTWLRRFPFTVAIDRIASDLGLLATAAAQREGNIALGGFLKALELVRQHSFDFDSASDLVGYLERIVEIDETEGCTALPPDENVVRVMNLHKAKGLEAPIVFLCDTSSRFGGDPSCHIDRSGDQTAGYMGIVRQFGKYQKKDVATPPDWLHWQEQERSFLSAEDKRLLYVATTRAACMMVVTVGSDRSNWSDLHSYLGDAQELSVPMEDVSHQSIDSPAIKPPKLIQREAITTRWDAVQHPSYCVETAKEVALKGTSRPNWQASGDYGYKWGSAVHELLEIATKNPTADLAAAAVMLAEQFGLGSERVDELLKTVQAVTQSDIWTRARGARRCFSELPLETVSQSDAGQPVITRAVIDLLFEEEDGWVIVDYKTDDIDAREMESAVQYYRRQLDQYAQNLSDATDAPVKEKGLYLTRINQYTPFR